MGMSVDRKETQALNPGQTKELVWGHEGTAKETEKQPGN